MFHILTSKSWKLPTVKRRMPTPKVRERSPTWGGAKKATTAKSRPRCFTKKTTVFFSWQRLQPRALNWYSQYFCSSHKPDDKHSLLTCSYGLPALVHWLMSEFFSDLPRKRDARPGSWTSLQIDGRYLGLRRFSQPWFSICNFRKTPGANVGLLGWAS